MELKGQPDDVREIRDDVWLAVGNLIHERHGNFAKISLSGRFDDVDEEI